MKCDEVLELEPEDLQAIEHRRECEDCRLMWESWRAPQAPARLSRNVLAELDRRRRWRGLRSWRLVAGLAAACYVGLLLTLGWVLTRPDPPPMMSPRLVRFWATAPAGPAPLEGGL